MVLPDIFCVLYPVGIGDLPDNLAKAVQLTINLGKSGRIKPVFWVYAGPFFLNPVNVKSLIPLTYTDIF